LSLERRERNASPLPLLPSPPPPPPRVGQPVVCEPIEKAGRRRRPPRQVRIGGERPMGARHGRVDGRVQWAPRQRRRGAQQDLAKRRAGLLTLSSGCGRPPAPSRWEGRIYELAARYFLERGKGRLRKRLFFLLLETV